MKKLLYLWPAMLLSCLCLCVTSCGGDDDDELDPSSDTDSDAPKGVVAVDLGLPSGTLWANMNVGATTPEEYGDYFAWGETEPKTSFTWSDYQWCTVSKYNSPSFTKYTTVHDELELEDDAAYVNWGSHWRMPTFSQLRELYDSDNTTTTWTTQNGVNGRLITSNKNGKSIFIPAAGYMPANDIGSRGLYWSRSLDYYDSLNPRYALILSFKSEGITWGELDRRYGLPVRPVYNK